MSGVRRNAGPELTPSAARSQLKQQLNELRRLSGLTQTAVADRMRERYKKSERDNWIVKRGKPAPESIDWVTNKRVSSWLAAGENLPDELVLVVMIKVLRDEARTQKTKHKKLGEPFDPTGLLTGANKEDPWIGKWTDLLRVARKRQRSVNQQLLPVEHDSDVSHNVQSEETSQTVPQAGSETEGSLVPTKGDTAAGPSQGEAEDRRPVQSAFQASKQMWHQNPAVMTAGIVGTLVMAMAVILIWRNAGSANPAGDADATSSAGVVAPISTSPAVKLPLTRAEVSGRLAQPLLSSVSVTVNPAYETFPNRGRPVAIPTLTMGLSPFGQVVVRFDSKDWGPPREDGMGDSMTGPTGFGVTTTADSQGNLNWSLLWKPSDTILSTHNWYLRITDMGTGRFVTKTFRVVVDQQTPAVTDWRPEDVDGLIAGSGPKFDVYEEQSGVDPSVVDTTGLIGCGSGQFTVTTIRASGQRPLSRFLVGFPGTGSGVVLTVDAVGQGRVSVPWTRGCSQEVELTVVVRSDQEQVAALVANLPPMRTQWSIARATSDAAPTST